MSWPPHPHSPHVPVLTEVIDLDFAPVDASDQEAPAGVVVEDDAALPPVLVWEDSEMSLSPLAEPPAPPLQADPRELPMLVDEVPELSEVVNVAEAEVPALPVGEVFESVEPQWEPDAEVVPEAAAMPAAAVIYNEDELAQRVLQDVQRQIDGMLEFRLRESMQPLMSQFIETLMQDLRDELSRTMRDVVNRAVAQELARLRNGSR